MARVIAHRGAGGIAAENSLEAFAAAIDAGADGIEVDVRLTRDGALVIYHDECLPPAAAGGEYGPRIDASTLAEVRRAVRRCTSGSGPPELHEVLALVAERAPGLGLVLDIKSAPWDRARMPAGRLLIDRIRPLLKGYASAAQVVVSSFDWDAVAYAAARLAPARAAFDTIAAHRLRGLHWAATGVDDLRDVLAYQEAWRQQHGPGMEALSLLAMIRSTGAAIWSCHHRDLTEASIRAARDEGLEVWTWTVNEAEDLDRVLTLDVGALLTDRTPLALERRALARRSAS